MTTMKKYGNLTLKLEPNIASLTRKPNWSQVSKCDLPTHPQARRTSPSHGFVTTTCSYQGA